MGTPIYSDTLAERDDPNRKQRAVFAHVMRSATGGPWTDNRRVQAEAVRGEVFLGVGKFADAIQAATAQITQRRANRAMRRAQKAFLRKAIPTPHAHADDEQRRPVTDPALRKLFDRPNAQQTFPAFLAAVRLQEMLTGNVLIWCNPDNVGRVREMFVLPTALCMWQPASAQYPRGAWRVYQPSYGLTYGSLAGSYALIPAEQVLHHKHLGHPLYHWDGLSPMTAVSKWVDILDAIDRSCWASMEGGVQRGTLVIVPGMSADEADAQNEKIRQTKAGPDNARRPWVIGTNDPNSKPEVTDPDSAKEMDFQTSRQNYAALVLAVMGVPPIVSGLKEAGSHAQLYASIKQFHDLTLKPWCASIAAALTAGVLSTWDDGDDDLKLQIDLPPVLNEDLFEQQMSGDAAVGGITYNEYRRARNRPPHPDPDADTLPVALFVKKLEATALPQPAPPPGQPGGDGAAPPDGGEPIDPDQILAGLGDGPESGGAPKPDNPAGAGSLPPQAKAFDARAVWKSWVTKAHTKAHTKAGAGRREGEVWEKNGRNWTLKNGRTVPAPRAGGGPSGPKAGAAKTPPAPQSGTNTSAPSESPAGAQDPAGVAAAIKALDPADTKAALEAAGFPGGSARSDTGAAFLGHVKGGEGPAARGEPAAPPDHPAAAGLHAAIDAAALPDGVKAKYKATVAAVTGRMPPRALDRIGKHLTGGAAFYATAKDVGLGAVGVGLALPNLSPESRAGLEKTKAEIERGEVEIRGAVTATGGASRLHLDGDFAAHGGEAGAYKGAGQTARDVYAHELAHAIDGPAFELSESWQWGAAYDREIGPNAGEPWLTRYAHTNKGEGFAEFGRLVYGGVVPLADVQRQFPEATKFFKARKLWPS